MAHLLDDARRAALDRLPVVDPRLGRTPLAWLGIGPTQATPGAVKDELDKLAYLRRLDAHTLDLSALPAERRRFLAGVGRRLTAQALQRRDAVRRYPILLTLLAQSAVDVLDGALLLFDQALSGRESVAKAKLTEVLAERVRGGEDRQALLDELLEILLDPRVADEEVGGLLREGVGLERLRAAWTAQPAEPTTSSAKAEQRTASSPSHNAGHNPGVHGAVLTEALASRFGVQIQVATDYDLAAGLKVNARAVRVARNLSSRQRSGEVGWAPYAESVVMPNRVRAQGHSVILAG